MVKEQSRLFSVIMITPTNGPAVLTSIPVCSHEKEAVGRGATILTGIEHWKCYELGYVSNLVKIQVIVKAPGRKTAKCE